MPSCEKECGRGRHERAVANPRYRTHRERRNPSCGWGITPITSQLVVVGGR